ncbi:MAG: hypothetical protein C0596_14195 [Marinilabiliales bacterium]|nr:MAG: hypothetical protein C0596_14195 [Marinilabiliales bacterium]
MRNKSVLLSLGIILLISLNSFAQYNNGVVGKNKIYETTYMDSIDENGVNHKIEVEVEVEPDSWGNANGNQYDLAVDGAFEGNTIVVLHLYTGEGFDFKLHEAALKEKGFGVYRYIDYPPDAQELETVLEKSCQLWIISGDTRKLNNEHLKVIKDYFDSGKGLYIWGDNDPFYADANFVAEALFGTKMLGNTRGDQVVGLSGEKQKSGLIQNHMISTGLQYIYEGITIATIQNNQNLCPLIYGSDKNVVAAIYEKDGKRAILDGGFTRLFCNWDTAGTGRYVKNAAAWLVNYEKFGDSVLISDTNDSNSNQAVTY